MIVKKKKEDAQREENKERPIVFMQPTRIFVLYF